MTRTSLLLAAGVFCLLRPAAAAEQANRIVIESDGWELIGDLSIPDSRDRLPAVLMLNQAAGNRQPYERLATELAERGIASLRLDLRGHGESTNLGEFIPQSASEQDRETQIWDANEDVVAAHQYLLKHPNIDSTRIGVVGASYSGEEMAEAGRNTAYAQAYVALSPGSFGDESIDAMDVSRVPWLFIVSKDDQFLHEIVAKVREKTQTVEILYIPGDKHATDILDDRTDLSERMATWLAANLTR